MRNESVAFRLGFGEYPPRNQAVPMLASVGWVTAQAVVMLAMAMPSRARPRARSGAMSLGECVGLIDWGVDMHLMLSIGSLWGVRGDRMTRWGGESKNLLRKINVDSNFISKRGEKAEKNLPYNCVRTVLMLHN